MLEFMCVCVCVRACVRACGRACVRVNAAAESVKGISGTFSALLWTLSEAIKNQSVKSVPSS